MLGNDNHIDPEVLSKYEGKCIGLIDNRVVCSGEDAGEVLRALLKKYKRKRVSLACVPLKSAKLAY